MATDPRPDEAQPSSVESDAQETGEGQQPTRQYAQDITGVGQPNMTNSQREYLRSLRGMQEAPRVRQRLRRRSDSAAPVRVPSSKSGAPRQSRSRKSGLFKRLKRSVQRWFGPGEGHSSRGPMGKAVSLLRGRLWRWARGERHAARREANWRTIRLTLLGVPLIGAALYGLHQWQLRSAAPRLLERAGVLESQQQWEAAAAMLRQFVSLQPENAEAKKRLVDVLARMAAAARDGATALSLRREAVQLLPDNVGQRRALGDLAMSLQRYEIAEEQADAILRNVPRDFSATRLLAMAAYGKITTGRAVPLESVVKVLERAVEQSPADAELVITLAALYRERYPVPSKTVSAATADGLIEQLVQKADKRAASYLARAWYRESYGQPGAAEDLATALELAPDDVEALLAAADFARRHREPERAEQHYRRALELTPTDLRCYLGLGQLQLDRGDFVAAKRAWRDGLEVHRKNPDPPVALILRLREAEAEIVRGELSDPAAALETVKKDVQGLNLRLTPAQVSQFETALDVLLSRYWLVQKKFDKALPLLKQAMTSVTANKSATAWTEVQLRYHLAACYEGLGQSDRAAELFEEASRLEPALPRHYLRAASAWGVSGRWSRAVELLRQASTMPACPDEAWVDLAHAELQMQLSLPITQRDLGGLTRALVAANDRGVTLEALPLLTADAQTMAGNPANALTALAAAYRQRPESSRLLRAYVLTLDRAARREEADQLLTNFAAQHGETLEVGLLRADLHQSRGQLPEARRVLTDAGARAAGTGQRALLQLETAELDLLGGQWDEARRLLSELVESHPEQLTLVEQLARLDLVRGDLPGVEKWEDRLREIEGQEGASWRYYRARRLLADATGPADPRLEEVRRLQNELEGLRPGWPQSHVLAGRLADVEGRADGALRAYESAIAFGDTELETYERLVALLYEQQDLLQAGQYLTLLGDAAHRSPVLSSLTLCAAVQQSQFEALLNAAQESARRRPQDALAQVWLAHALALSGRRGDAEQALLAAQEIAPSDPRPRLALVEFYVRDGQWGPARAALQQMSSVAGADPAALAFALAQGSEMLRDDKTADEKYRLAMQQAPDNAQVHLRAAAFFHDRDPAAAAQARAQALSLARTEGEARRSLALALMRRGGAKNLPAVQDLFRERLDVEPEDRRQDVRLEAFFALRYGGPEERNASAVRLEQILDQQKIKSSDDYALLARLLEADEQLVAASENLAKAASPVNPLPEHLAAYADVLLRLQRPSDARPWYEKLADLEPGSFRALRLQGRLMQLSGQADQTADTLTAAVEEQLARLSHPAQRASFCWQAAALFDTLDEVAAAEAWHRRALEADSAGFPAYVRFLMRRGRADDAVEFCDGELESRPSAAAVRLLCEALVRGRASQEAVRERLPTIRQVVVKNANDPDLLAAAGDLYWFGAGSTDDAAKLYRRAAAIRPDHLSALNNLAWLTGETGGNLSEALQRIEQALNFGGRLPWLEDTQAMLLLRQGETEQAVRSLRALAAGKNSTPLTLFHLAEAYRTTGDTALARLSLRQAIERNLDGELLTPGEEKLRQELEQALAE